VISTTSRIDYANDTNVAASKGPLDSARKFTAATSSKDFGFVAGGAADPASSVFTTIERLDYSNDSSTMVVRGDLSEMRQKYQATGNVNFGYFIGGAGNNNSPTFSSTVQRLNYANDSVGTTQRAGIFRPKQLGGATSSPAFAYVSGGRDYSSGATTVTSRIDYSNDGVGGLQKGGLPTQTTQLGATGNKNFGYYSGGITPAAPSGVSITNRLDYASDTALLSPKGNLTGSKLNLKATGSQSFGYFSGGGSGACLCQCGDVSSSTVLVFQAIWTASNYLHEDYIQEHLDEQQKFYKKFYNWKKKGQEWTNFLKGALNEKK
jgi:hypothetical protein